MFDGSNALQRTSSDTLIVGTLAELDRRIYFEYDDTFLNTGPGGFTDEAEEVHERRLSCFAQIDVASRRSGF